VKWGKRLVFKIGGKAFAAPALEPAPVWLSFKCSPEAFAELVERRHHPSAVFRAQLAGHPEMEDALTGNGFKSLVRLRARQDPDRAYADPAAIRQSRQRKGFPSLLA